MIRACPRETIISGIALIPTLSAMQKRSIWLAVILTRLRALKLSAILEATILVAVSEAAIHLEHSMDYLVQRRRV